MINEIEIIQNEIKYILNHTSKNDTLRENFMIIKKSINNIEEISDFNGWN